jgi:hypothetical protein
MNEEYLWDKSGDPDPEIERLEKSLASFRFKRPLEPLPLPANSRWQFQLRSSPPALAAAAALLLLLLGGGLWLGLQRRAESPSEKPALAAGSTPQVKQAVPEFSGPRPPIGTGNPGEPGLNISVKDEGVAPAPPVASRRARPRRNGAARQQMARHRAQEIAPSQQQQIARHEGEQAKAKLIMALHIASDKLNEVQKKIQSNPGT